MPSGPAGKPWQASRGPEKHNGCAFAGHSEVTSRATKPPDPSACSLAIQLAHIFYAGYILKSVCKAKIGYIQNANAL